MARLARVVIPNEAHHVTQRGNRRQTTFFRDDDYLFYLSLLAEWSSRYELAILAYCLMPNHVHLIVIPSNNLTIRLTHHATYIMTKCYSR